MNPRLTLEPIAHGIAVIIDTYCAWITAYNQRDGFDPMSPTAFFDRPARYDEIGLDWSPYVELDADPYTTYDYEVWSLTVDYGDDGGPQGLTAWFGYDYEFTVQDKFPVMTPHAALEHLTQTFDTRLSLVMEDGKLTFNGKDSP